MKLKNILISIITLAVIVVVVLATNNNNAVSQPGSDNKVGATIFPIYDIAQQVAGDEFEVVLLLPPGASPHVFESQPSVLKKLQGAQAVFAIGYGLDTWSETITDSLDIPVVTVDHDVDLRATVEQDHKEHDHEEGHQHDHEEEGHHDEHEDEDDHHGHDHGPIDPHYWLSLHNAEQIVMSIAEELSRLDAENSSLYIERAQNYIEELQALEVDLQQQAAGIAGANIISLHDAWYYFADEFDLNIVGTFATAGKEPTPQYLAHLEEEVEENNVATLFMEPQLSTNAIQAFADDHDLGIATIDPLGGVEDRDSYIALMRYNVGQVVDALTQ